MRLRDFDLDRQSAIEGISKVASHVEIASQVPSLDFFNPPHPLCIYETVSGNTRMLLTNGYLFMSVIDL